MTEFEKLKRELRKKRKATEPEGSSGLSTGCTLLNLACTGKPNVGLIPGHHYLLVGDSQAGKTWLTMQILAEAANNPAFDGHRLIHDNPERGALMDVPRFFGQKLADRLEAPSKKGSSTTIEEFYDNISDAAATPSPFIYVLDSEDALSSEDELKKAEANKKARRNDGEVKGSYGDKAKKNSAGLRQAHNLLGQSGSILIMVKQTRDNIGFDAMFNPKTRSGGRALTFYASLELWFAVKGKIKKTVMGKPRTVGTILKIHVKKNRVSGRDRTVEVPFYPTVGMDDVGSLCDYLVEEKHWKRIKKNIDPKNEEKASGVIIAPEFDHKGSVEKLVRKIEREGLERRLRKLAVQTWNEVEAACAVERKSRYA